MNLREWARQQDVHPQTAYRWFRTGTLPVPARKMGKLILVGDLEAGRVSSRLTAVYARVSSADQRDDLDRQVARVSSWAAAHGSAVDRMVTEVGSGLNGKDRKFLGLCPNPKVTTIAVEHRDRFAGASAPSSCARVVLRRAVGDLVVIDDGVGRLRRRCRRACEDDDAA